MNRELMEYAKSVAQLVDSVILEAVKGGPKELYEASLHYVKAGGKRLRPLVTFLFGEGLGCRNRDALARVAAAIEVLHTYTLIHDDIMDRDTVRRGVPTVHVLWGDSMAILAGDLLYAYAFKLIAASKGFGLSGEQVSEILDVVSWASIELAEGQAMDMSFENRDYVPIEEYMEMIKKKTAALFEACAAVGAIAAGAPKNVIASVREVMRLAGIAFQIKDDILGITVATEKLGKPRYSDIREGKKTLPIILALEKLDASERSFLLKVLRKELRDEDSIVKAASLIEKCSAISESESIAKKYIEEAISKLEGITFESAKHKQLLIELLKFLVYRGY